MILQPGSTGPNVVQLQTLLGLPLKDGVYGPGTQAAVAAFQDAHGLKKDGVAGPKTLALIFPHADLCTAIARLARAQSAVNKGVVYALGRGGYHPEDALPSRERTAEGKLSADCSGFLSWCCGISRDPGQNETGYPQWISTDSFWSDAGGGQILFVQVPKPQAGCIVVYPDPYDAQGHKLGEGHVGLIVDPVTMSGIDCSSSQSKNTGDAIHLHDLSFFARKPQVRYVMTRSDFPVAT